MYVQASLETLEPSSEQNMTPFEGLIEARFAFREFADADNHLSRCQVILDAVVLRLV